MAFEYDFSGYVTRNDLKCSDGRVIRAGAFADQDGVKVPLVWNHDHKDMSNVIGHVMLKNRDDGVYGYGSFNDTPNGRSARQLVSHGDIEAMSIYANKLKQKGADVLHGIIREVSLVYAGANPGAYIDSIISHEDGSDEEAIIYPGEQIDICHGSVADDDDKEPNEKPKEEPKEKQKEETPKKRSIKDIIDGLSEEKKAVAMFIIGKAMSGDEDDEPKEVSHADDDDESDIPLKNGKTVKEIFDTFTEEEKNAVYAILGDIADEKKSKNNTEDDEEEKTMKHNAFDKSQDFNTIDGVLTHDDQTEIIKMAKEPGCGSLRSALTMYANSSEHLAHGIDEIETLFPEYKDVKPGAPEVLTDELAWVAPFPVSVPGRWMPEAGSSVARVTSRVSSRRKAAMPS